MVRIFVHNVTDYDSDDSGEPMGVVREDDHGDADWEDFVNHDSGSGYPTVEEALTDLLDSLAASIIP